MKANHRLCMLGLAVMAIALPVIAGIDVSFSGWGELTTKSPDIIVARCNRTPDPFKDHGAGPTGALFNSDIEIMAILKGATNWGLEPLKIPSLGPARLCSEYVPRQGEYYLLFSVYDYGYYQTLQNYCVVPLGLYFSTNSITGKPLDEQIQILLKRRLDDLNRQMNEEEEEKDRLEEALQK